MKKKLEMLLMVLAVISISVNLISCANVSDVEVKQYAENESKKEEELNKEISKVRESKEDNRTETIIGGKEEAKDKEEETVGKEPETYEYTTNEAGEKVYKVYDEYLGEEVDNPKLYKDEYYIGEGKGKKVPTYDTLADKWANYSKEVRDIIEKYEGKDYQTSRTITQSELKTLHNAGLYMITADTTYTVDSNSNRKDSGGHNEIMTKEQLEQYIRDNTTVNSSNNINSSNNNSNISGNNNSSIGGNNNSGNNIGGNNNNSNVGGNNGTITNNTAGDTTNNKNNAIRNNSIMTQALNPSTYAIYDADAGEIARNVRKKIQEGLWEDREAERDKIARMYAKKNTDPNNPAQYINSLGNGNYVVKCGLVVPSEENATYYESLRGQDKIIYWYTEWMCFKQNNQGRITIVKDTVPKAKYKENTFGDLGEGNVGEMLWLSRVYNEERVTFWGKPQYAVVSKTFPEYYDKCGGTDMACAGWANTPKEVPVDYTYNKIVEGTFEKEKNLFSLMDREWW